jgi:hypothetical protein
MLQDVLLVMEVLQLEDIISLEKLEVSFIIYIGKFGSKDSH